MAHKWPLGVWLSTLINACTALVKMTQDEIRHGTTSEKEAATESIMEMYNDCADLMGFVATTDDPTSYSWTVTLTKNGNAASNQDYIDVYNQLLDYEDDNEDLIDVAILQDSQDPTQLSVG